MEQNELQKLREAAASVPKQKNLAIFFGRAGSYFIDNVKYFFLHCVQHQPAFQCCFMTFTQKDATILKEQGLPAMWVSNPEAAGIMAKAGLVVSDDFIWKNNLLSGPCSQKQSLSSSGTAYRSRPSGFPKLIPQ